MASSRTPWWKFGAKEPQTFYDCDSWSQLQGFKQWNVCFQNCFYKFYRCLQLHNFMLVCVCLLFVCEFVFVAERDEQKAFLFFKSLACMTHLTWELKDLWKSGFTLLDCCKWITAIQWCCYKLETQCRALTELTKHVQKKLTKNKIF